MADLLEISVLINLMLKFGRSIGNFVEYIVK